MAASGNDDVIDSTHHRLRSQPFLVRPWHLFPQPQRHIRARSNRQRLLGHSTHPVRRQRWRHNRVERNHSVSHAKRVKVLFDNVCCRWRFSMRRCDQNSVRHLDADTKGVRRERQLRRFVSAVNLENVVRDRMVGKRRHDRNPF